MCVTSSRISPLNATSRSLSASSRIKIPRSSKLIDRELRKISTILPGVATTISGNVFKADSCSWKLT